VKHLDQFANEHVDLHRAQAERFQEFSAPAERQDRHALGATQSTGHSDVAIEHAHVVATLFRVGIGKGHWFSFGKMHKPLHVTVRQLLAGTDYWRRLGSRP
jgi:hypothetical protein